MKKKNLGLSFELVILPLYILLLTFVPLAFSQCPSDTGEWMLFKDSCYKFHNTSEFWYTAEMTCQETNGHLVSIDSDSENRLVARLSLCHNVWIGKYGTDLKRLSEPSAYEWSDEKTGHEYHRHNFSDSAPTVHKPLIRASNMYWHNSLYHEKYPFMCEVPATGEHKTRCPATMKYYQGNCYLLSSFETTFIEANFYCQNHSTQLTSILSGSELRFINALDLSADSCQLETLWLGLIRLDPCYMDRSRQQCWEWTDFSGLYANLPSWADGEPSVGGGESTQGQQGCALIRGDHLYGVSCAEKHKFACKIPAESLTPGNPAWQKLESPAQSGEALANTPPTPQLPAEAAPPASEAEAEVTSKSNITLPGENGSTTVALMSSRPAKGAGETAEKQGRRRNHNANEEGFNLNDLFPIGPGVGEKSTPMVSHGKRDEEEHGRNDVEDRFSSRDSYNFLTSK